MQRQVIDASESKIFASELEELWQVYVDQQHTVDDALMKFTGINYVWAFNVERMRDVSQDELIAE